MSDRGGLLARSGPGLLVTAAFIGPGTVTTASRAGASTGFMLMWALVFATVATIVLQEMAARLGLVTRMGLGEAVREALPNRRARGVACGLIVLAIGFGNAAYQTGNVVGAGLGLAVLTGTTAAPWAIAVGGAAFALLLSGAYRLVERVLIALVVLMSLVFLVTAAAVRPDLGAIVRGAFVPRLPAGSLATALGLIGTTIVPYNLFLHAGAVRQKWPATVPIGRALREARLDAMLAIGLGGVVTAAILTTAAATADGRGGPVDAASMARQLAPTVGGRAASVLFALGLFAAGLTSAITAPLAASIAVGGALGWPFDLRSARTRAVWMAVVVVGTALAATLGRSPTETILLAQAANGVLLPLIAGFLLIAVNRRSSMGGHANGPAANAAGAAIVLVVAALAIRSLLRF